MTYVEPAQLSPAARVIVVLVEGVGRVSEGRIVGSQVIQTPGQKPIAFKVGYTKSQIDSNLVYTIQAAVLDGDKAWVTAAGTPVITKGNPSSAIALTATFRPDLLAGEVSGQIGGVNVDVSGEAFSVAVLMNVRTDQPVGFDANADPTAVPIGFGVGFDPATIDSNTDYVVIAGVVNGARRWTNTTGVPVITKGNPLSGITVAVAEAVPPAPSPTPVPGSDHGPGNTDSGSTGLILLLILIAVIVGAVLLYNRSRETPPPVGPDGTGDPDAAMAGAAAGTAADEAAGAEGEPSKAGAEGETSEAAAAGAETADATAPPASPPPTSGTATESDRKSG